MRRRGEDGTVEQNITGKLLNCGLIYRHTSTCLITTFDNSRLGNNNALDNATMSSTVKNKKALGKQIVIITYIQVHT